MCQIRKVDRLNLALHLFFIFSYLFQPAVRFENSTSDSSSLAPPARKSMSKNGNISSAGSSPATSPQTPHRKPNKLKKLKGLKGIKPKMLQKFKMAAQKVNKAQEYIDKTR